MTRVQYLTLAAISLIASASIFVSGALVFRAISNEFGISLLFSLFLAFGLALPVILIALRFFRKAKTERAVEQDGKNRLDQSSPSAFAG